MNYYGGPPSNCWQGLRLNRPCISNSIKNIQNELDL